MVTVVPEIDKEGFYGITDTCKLLGIHRNTLRRYTGQNKIGYVIRKADGRTLYKGSEIIRLITTNI